MKCARLKLQQRSKTSPKQRAVTAAANRPRHYCQQVLANPRPEEGSRWREDLERSVKRFQCHPSEDSENSSNDFSRMLHQENTYLTVQNLQFLGNQQHRRRPRTSFKYKTLTDGGKHRMFVKQEILEGQADDDQFSQLTCYYLEDYSRYITSPSRSRPTSGKSVQANIQQHKAVQTEPSKTGVNKKVRKEQIKTKNITDVNTETECTTETKDKALLQDTKVAFHKFGKLKSLTLSRAQSPETIQVIRVDVVCNNYNTRSIISDSEDQNNLKCEKITTNKPPQSKEDDKIKNCYYANKYLLTNTYKKLDQNVSGGTKVTLHCKTFRLFDRSKQLNQNKFSKE